MRTILVLLALIAVSSADVTRPVYLGLTELRAGQFDVVWRVPSRGGRVLAIRAQLPEVFRETTVHAATLAEAVQTTRWTVEAKPWELPGAVIRIDGPARSRVDVMVRFEFLDGTVVVRVLPPEVTECAFPMRPSARSPSREIQSAVSAGLGSVAASLPYCVFLFALALCGQARIIGTTLGFLLVGHLGGVALGLPIPEPVANALLAVAAAVIAAAALRSEYRGLGPVALVCGFAHGAVLPGGFMGALGADAAGLITSLTVMAVLPQRWRSGVGYLVGIGAVTVALIEATAAGPAPEQTRPSSVLFAPAARSAETPASSPVATATGAPLQLFLEVTPFETRVECVAELKAFGVGDGEDVAVPEQEALKARIHELFAAHVSVEIMSEPATAAESRVDFVTREAGGVLERVEPIVEKFEDALVGIALSFPTPEPPTVVVLNWKPMAGAESIPLVVVDPRKTQSASLDEATPQFWWNGVFFVPPGQAVDVSAPGVDVSVVSIGLLLLALIVAIRRFRRGGAVAARLLVAAACFAAPYLPIPIPMPGSSTPGEAQVQEVVEALLTNLYRGMEQPDESKAYDRLRVSVTEDALRPIYLEQRRMLELGRRGGARARVDAIEVARVHSIEPIEGERVRARVAWEAAGFVVHYGHRHFRQNHYEADVELVVEHGSWKFAQLAVTDKERLR